MDEAALQPIKPAWHNPLPLWISQDIESLRRAEPRQARGIMHTLQAMADAGDYQRATGDILNIFGGQGMADRAGCSLRTFWRHLTAMEARGYVVVIHLGGVNAGRNIASIYGIPGQRHGLKDRRRQRRMQQVITDPTTGTRQRVTIQPGHQSNIWPPAPEMAPEMTPETTATKPADSAKRSAGGSVTKSWGVVTRSHRGSDMMAHNHSPLTIPHGNKNHAAENGDGCLRTDDEKSRRGSRGQIRGRWRMPSLTAAQLRDTPQMARLMASAIAGGLICPNESDQLWWWCAIEHALRVGQNPGALLRTMLANPQKFRLWITEADEARAVARLKPSRPPVDSQSSTGRPQTPQAMTKPTQARQTAKPAASSGHVSGGPVLMGDTRLVQIRIGRMVMDHPSVTDETQRRELAWQSLQAEGWNRDQWNEAIKQAKADE